MSFDAAKQSLGQCFHFFDRGLASVLALLWLTACTRTSEAFQILCIRALCGAQFCGTFSSRVPGIASIRRASSSRSLRTTATLFVRLTVARAMPVSSPSSGIARLLFTPGVAPCVLLSMAPRKASSSFLLRGELPYSWRMFWPEAHYGRLLLRSGRPWSRSGHHHFANEAVPQPLRAVLLIQSICSVIT